MKGEKTGGRKKGVKNKASVKRIEEIAATGLTPLDYMLNTLRDSTKEDTVRMEAAKSAAPYIHPKLSAIEHTGKDGADLMPQDKTPAETARRIAFILAQAMHSK